MEIFLKRYGWTLNVAVVIVAGLVAGRTVSALSAVHLSEPPKIETPDTDAPRAVHTVSSTVNADGLATLFGLELPSDEPEPEPVPEEIDLGEEVPTSLNATLVATVEANPERYSLALITDNSSRSTAVYGVGDLLMGSAEVLRVERRRVLVRNNDRTEYLEMDGENGSEAAVASSARRAPVTAARRQSARRPSRSSKSSGPDLSDSIRRTGENEYSVDQEAIEGALSDLNSIATQARIVPAFKDGEAQGFKLFSIRPGSIYSQIGIQNGDVVRSVNGFDINSPDRALEVYQRLRESSRVEVEIERRGQTIRKVYDID